MIQKIIIFLEEKHIISYCTIFNLLLLSIVFIIKDSQKEIIDAISVFVLILTFFAIVYYSVETSNLRKIMEKQVNLAILPLVNLVSIGNTISIKNSGKSPALNVVIEQVKNRNYPVPNFSSGREGTYSFSFGESIPLLNVSEEKQIATKVIPPNIGPQNPKADPFLNPSNQEFSGKYEVEINYEDIESKKITTIFEISENGIKFKKIKK